MRKFTREYYRQLDPSVFIDAANAIEEGRHMYTCVAVIKACCRGQTGHVSAWRDHFHHKRGFWGEEPSNRLQKLRADCLLMMAEIVRQGKR